MRPVTSGVDVPPETVANIPLRVESAGSPADCFSASSDARGALARAAARTASMASFTDAMETSRPSAPASRPVPDGRFGLLGWHRMLLLLRAAGSVAKQKAPSDAGGAW
jgi:hypothetical protein